MFIFPPGPFASFFVGMRVGYQMDVLLATSTIKEGFAPYFQSYPFAGVGAFSSQAFQFVLGIAIVLVAAWHANNCYHQPVTTVMAASAPIWYLFVYMIAKLFGATKCRRA
jgi:hypothetical protein